MAEILAEKKRKENERKRKKIDEQAALKKAMIDEHAAQAAVQGNYWQLLPTVIRETFQK